MAIAKIIVDLKILFLGKSFYRYTLKEIFKHFNLRD